MHRSVYSSIQVALSITEQSQVGRMRRRAAALARDMGFDDPQVGKVAIMVSELGGNLVKHASQGQMLLGSMHHENIDGIEIMALDKGPGIANMPKCLYDGYSTTGSAGTGLGAVIRLSDLFDIHSVPGKGTAVLAHLWSRPLPRALRPPRIVTGAVCLPAHEKEKCGDAWATQEGLDRSLILVVDGLGHGRFAFEAAEQAVRVFKENPELGPAEMINKAHSALRGTRGAALGIAELDHNNSLLTYAGVGNTACVILSSKGQKNMASHAGIVGQRIRKIQQFTYSLDHEAVLVMHSDGLSSRWSLDNYRAFTTRHPSVIAGVLYRDFKRKGDDVGVVSARVSPREE